MNLDQAYKILDYSIVPEKREDRIKLIQIIGYTRLRGGNLLPDCHDRQLRRVAERLFRKAEDKVHAELREINEEEVQEHYENSLYAMFNISEEERAEYTISELEEQLMQ
ncbi:MAG: hypothetical protein Q8R47_05995 [Nanoarchaeota archaeon]|nr:hypothetical protein [Nanoarchaeota archaeon]